MVKSQHVAVVALLAVAACSGGDDEQRAGVTSAPNATQTSTTAAPADPEASATTAITAITTAATPAATATTGPVTAATIGEPVDLPEVGVPGLASDDAFCAAWSRWAGSYQVVLVTNAFGSGGPGALAALEVVAAPVLVEAAATMSTEWPDAIATERDLAVDGLLGPITRRLIVAREALVAAGADGEMLASIEAAWLDALAARDPTTPEVAVDLPDEVWAVVDRAASDVSAQLVAFADDPSLVTSVETPLTDAYLAANCPDQGTLSGQEIDP